GAARGSTWTAGDGAGLHAGTATGRQPAGEPPHHSDGVERPGGLRGSNTVCPERVRPPPDGPHHPHRAGQRGHHARHLPTLDPGSHHCLATNGPSPTSTTSWASTTGR